ncbi:MAG: hypothetical protein ABSG53_09185 [Thermoguttaceae bacterium]|jgi:hypothetical protein
MSQQITLYALVDTTLRRRIHAICGTAEEADKIRKDLLAMAASAPASAPCATNLEIHAMNAAFPGDRYRLVYGRPMSTPSHPLEAPGFQGSRVPYTDAQSDAYLYPDELFVYRKEALAAAAKYNLRQLCRPGGPLDWAVVVEIGEPLWRRYRSECLVRKGLGWEETDLVRPVRVIHPTDAEVTSSSQPSRADAQGSTYE